MTRDVIPDVTAATSPPCLKKLYNTDGTKLLVHFMGSSHYDTTDTSKKIASTPRRTLGLLAVTGKYLNKDYDTRKTTDLYIVFPGSVDELPVSVDYTCHCPFLPVYRRTAYKDFEFFMKQRHEAKTRKHFKWCDNHVSKRLFIAAAGTTIGGTGTKPFWDLIDKVFTRAIIKDQILGGTGYGIQEQRRLFMQRLQSIIIRYTAQSVAALSGAIGS